MDINTYFIEEDYQMDLFLRQVYNIAEKYSSGKAQTITCVCQAICESNWGKSGLSVKGKNLFGIKANKNWKGNVYSAKTKECYDGVNYVTIKDSFRAYDSYEESIKDYFKLMNTPRYKKSTTAKTVEECITIIKNSGYATSPSYINTIMRIYNEHKNDFLLTEYDILITNYYNKPSISTNSLVDALVNVGCDGTYASRKIIANNNGIYNYRGTYAQNVKLLKLLNNGELKK